MPPSADVCASLCDDVADAVHPDHDFLARHGADVTSTADAMLARLDELAAMLGTLRAEGREQREALEPVLEAFAAGLARDFAYVDSVEDTVSAIGTAVTTTENQLSALESTHFKNARLAEVESARRGIENLFTRVGGVTADLGRAGGTLAGGFAAFSTELAASAHPQRDPRRRRRRRRRGPRPSPLARRTGTRRRPVDTTRRTTPRPRANRAARGVWLRRSPGESGW